jgi:hypothetical protein
MNFSEKVFIGISIAALSICIIILCFTMVDLQQQIYILTKTAKTHNQLIYELTGKPKPMNEGEEYERLL